MAVESPFISQPRLTILAGPNGSGKSVFFDRRLAKWNLPFVNPDLIALEIAPGDPANAAFQAAHLARDRRNHLLRTGTSFVTEGIRPDPEFLQEASARGYFTRVIFICLHSPKLNVARVMIRVSTGGHRVPEGAIVARYDRALKSLPRAAEVADQLLLLDNSDALRPYRLIARFNFGKVSSLRWKVPAWANSVFAEEFERFRADRARANTD